MEKSLLDIVRNFASWNGNPFTLAALLLAEHTELIKRKLIDAGYPEAAELV